jgi:hypothetical protein
VLPGVSAQLVDGAYRPCREERVHERVLRVLGHIDKGRRQVSAGSGVDTLRDAFVPVPGLHVGAGTPVKSVVVDAKVAGTAGSGRGHVLVHQAHGVLKAGQPLRFLFEAGAEVSGREQAQGDLSHAGLARLRALDAQRGQFCGVCVLRAFLQPRGGQVERGRAVHRARSRRDVHGAG